MRLANAGRLLPCVALLWLSAPAARADQVHTDPNSPTSKEYAIPLDSARHAAAPHSGSGSASSGSSSGRSQAAPLFGVGVHSSTPAAAATKPATKHATRHRTHRRTKSSAGAAPTGSSGPPAPPSHLDSATDTPGGGVTTPVLIGGLAAAALLVGGLGGLALRRRTA